MFRVDDDYVVEFERSRTTGDTECFLIRCNSVLARYSGVAKLHPKDRPDKITGKKIALQRALADGQLSKPERTRVWAAFWAWVKNWKRPA